MNHPGGNNRGQTMSSYACPHCGYTTTRVASTNRRPEGLRRTRHCLRPSCGQSFTTYEVSDVGAELLRMMRRTWERKGRLM